jgi:hypothetical protein
MEKFKVVITGDAQCFSRMRHFFNGHHDLFKYSLKREF